MTNLEEKIGWQKGKASKVVENYGLTVGVHTYVQYSSLVDRIEIA